MCDSNTQALNDYDSIELESKISKSSEEMIRLSEHMDKASALQHLLIVGAVDPKHAISMLFAAIEGYAIYRNREILDGPNDDLIDEITESKIDDDAVSRADEEFSQFIKQLTNG